MLAFTFTIDSTNWYLLLLVLIAPVWYLFEYFSKDTSHVILYINSNEVFEGSFTDMLKFITKHNYKWRHDGKIFEVDRNTNKVNWDDPIGHFVEL